MTDHDGVDLTLTIDPPPAATGGPVDTVDLGGVDWPAVIPAAVAATDRDDIDALPLPRSLPELARRVILVWARHPTDDVGCLNWQGVYIRTPHGTRPATDDEPGDRLAFELVGGSPYYPRHADRPVDAIRAAVEGIRLGEPVDLEDVADWWPATVIIDRQRPGITWVDLDAGNGAPILHASFRNAPPPEPLADVHGEPLRTLAEHTDPAAAAVASAVEQVRRSKTPGGRPVGRPPSVGALLDVMTNAERLTAACLACEQGGRDVSQAEVARLTRTRPDSLNRALRRRARRRL